MKKKAKKSCSEPEKPECCTAQDLRRLESDLAALRYTVGNLLTRVVMLESRPIAVPPPVPPAGSQTPWLRSLFRRHDSDET